MMSSLRILLMSGNVPGITEIMCGYLRYYSQERADVFVHGATTLPDQAVRVMAEDSIEDWAGAKPLPGGHFDIIVCFPGVTDTGAYTADKKQFIELSPIECTHAKMGDLDAFRRLREIMRIQVLEILGNALPAIYTHS